MKIKIDEKDYEVNKVGNKWTLPNEVKEMLYCRSSCLNIDGNRVETSDKLGQESGFIRRGRTDEEVFMGNDKDRPKGIYKEIDGRYPSQTFCDSNTAEMLDKQSGIKTSRPNKVEIEEKLDKGMWEDDFGYKNRMPSDYTDTGGCSKILHKCNYEQEDHDLYFYNPKVSKSERNAGCDGEPQQYSHDGRETPIENPYQRNKSMAINNHPTLKPIALNEKILKLFKTPNDDKIVYPFAGSGSEIVGGIKAGFTNWVGCEINPDYVEIAKARIEYWTKQQKQISIFELERE